LPHGEKHAAHLFPEAGATERFEGEGGRALDTDFRGEEQKGVGTKLAEKAVAAKDYVAAKATAASEAIWPSEREKSPREKAKAKGEEMKAAVGDAADQAGKKTRSGAETTAHTIAETGEKAEETGADWKAKMGGEHKPAGSSY